MKTHSTVSRRDFMKALGLGAAGVAAAGAVAPVFADLDDVLTSGDNIDRSEKRPWWVKEKDKPTVNVDWSIQRRGDQRYIAHSLWVEAQYVGKQEVLDRRARGAAKRIQLIKDKAPGMLLKDQALMDGSAQLGQLLAPGSTLFKLPDGDTSNKTYEAPRWDDTPENNSKMLRAALRFLGAGTVGFGELDQEKKDKYVLQYSEGGANHSPAYIDDFPPSDTVSKRIIFEDVDEGYETDTRYVLPNNVPLYYFSFNLPMSREGYRTGNSSGIEAAANSARYRLFKTLHSNIQYFINVLGYKCYGYPTVFGGLLPASGSSILTGVGEGARNSGYTITPEWGTINGFYSLVTDLPLASTKPIDAGIWRFCHTCNKCAETCPVDAIPKDKEPTYEPPDIYGKTDITHAAGKKQFWQNGVDCWMFLQEYSGCGSCMATCTFNTNNASIHNLVKSTLAITPLFNGFLWNADKFYGYGLIEEGKKEEWWSKSLPSFGWDSTFAARDGGY